MNSCVPLSGYIANSSDCDDNDSSVYPGATELCDGLVNDCGAALGPVETDDDGDQRGDEGRQEEKRACHGGYLMMANRPTDSPTSGASTWKRYRPGATSRLSFERRSHGTMPVVNPSCWSVWTRSPVTV